MDTPKLMKAYFFMRVFILKKKNCSKDIFQKKVICPYFTISTLCSSSYCLLPFLCSKTSNYGLREIWWQLGSSRSNHHPWLKNLPGFFGSEGFFWTKIERAYYLVSVPISLIQKWTVYTTYLLHFLIVVYKIELSHLEKTCFCCAMYLR